MLRQLIASLGMLGLLGAGTAAAQSIEDFELNSTADLVDVCAPADGAASADVALAFCYGYIVGGSDLYAGLVQAGAIKPWACAEPTRSSPRSAPPSSNGRRTTRRAAAPTPPTPFGRQ